MLKRPVNGPASGYKAVAWNSFWWRLPGGLLIGALILGVDISPGWAAEGVSGTVAFTAFSHQKALIERADGTRFPLIVELARTSEERSHGLMFRTALEEGRGMLFDFSAPMRVRMWMKNTLIPLDMLFLDQHGRVTFMVQNAVPGDLTPVGPADPARGVLELPGGQVQRWGLAVGDRLLHPLFQ